MNAAELRVWPVNLYDHSARHTRYRARKIIVRPCVTPNASKARAAALKMPAKGDGPHPPAQAFAKVFVVFRWSTPVYFVDCSSAW